MRKRTKQAALKSEIQSLHLEIYQDELALKARKRRLYQLKVQAYELETGLKVGKRIEINGIQGEVVDHSYSESPYAIFSPYKPGTRKVTGKRIPVYNSN